MSRATLETMHELHRALTEQLRKKLSGDADVGAAYLSVARAFLKQEGDAGRAQTQSERDALRTLHGMLCDCLFEALTRARPGASVLAEVRHFLRDNGVTKELGEGPSEAQALRLLTSANLPFPNQ